MRHVESRKMLGTTVEIIVRSERPGTGDRIEAVFGYFASIESEFSRFRPDSALCRLNREKRLEVSGRFLEMLSLCRECHHQSEGRFNPLANVSVLGYSAPFGSAGFGDGAGSATVDTDFSNIRIHGNSVELGEFQNLDFGGIAKGYAVDGACRMLREFGYSDFLVNAWGDIRACGTNGTESGWRIGIENPFSLRDFASVLIRDGAVATSGRYRRKWESHGSERHHIVDPASGWNRFDVVSVTLLAAECARADALTKAVFNLSRDGAVDFLQERGLPGMVIDPAGDAYQSERFVREFWFVLIPEKTK